MADQVLCNSKTTLNSFSSVEKKITRGKTKVCYNGVNIHTIKIAQNDKEKKQSDIIIGSVGRFIEVKDHQTLIDAFSIFKKRKKDIDAKLLLIGDGKLRNQLEKQVEKNQLNNNVIFTGNLDRDLVFGLLKEMDIFVVSSKWEGFCNALVEAMAAEKAIVCSDIPVLREVAGDAALFVKPGKPVSFAQNIIQLLENDDLFNKMSKKAGERAQKFTLCACAERYIAHYFTN
jgi:glycosyltransferase involved in cell wall biosynthesis